MARTGLVAAIIASLILSLASLMITSHPNDRTDLPARISSYVQVYSDSDLASYADRGSGTESDPYVIENRNLSGGSYGMAYLYIANTRSHLVIRNVEINGMEGVVGMYLINVTNVLVEDCWLRNSEIRSFWFKSITFSNNYIYASGIDIGSGWVGDSDLTGNSNLAIVGNEIVGSQIIGGISLNDCENATVTDNTVSECNTTGLGVSRSKNVLVGGNKLIRNLGGLSVWDSRAVTIVANDIVDSNWTGVRLDSSSDVLVHHNNIMNNTFALDLWTENVRTALSLEYPHGGNYWSNNTAPDLFSGPGQNLTGSDGISDLPVNLSYGIRDQYPLSAPFVRTNNNEHPLAMMQVLPHFGRPNCTFILSAAATWDSEDSATDMQYRWDWTNDGSWDTAWSSELFVAYKHASQFNGTVRMSARDRDGLTNETTYQLIIDRLAPILSTDFGPGKVKFTTHDSFWINWSCEEDLSGLAEIDPDSFTSTGHFRILVNGIELRDPDCPGNGFMMIYTGNGYNETVNLSIGGLPDGAYVVAVQAIDVAGNSAELRIVFEIRTNPLHPSGEYGIWPSVALAAGVSAVVIALIYLAVRPKKGSPEASSIPGNAETL